MPDATIQALSSGGRGQDAQAGGRGANGDAGTKHDMY